jgi:hypothetical protein
LPPRVPVPEQTSAPLAIVREADRKSLALFVSSAALSIDLTESGDAVVAHTKSEDHFELAMLVTPSRRGSGNEPAIRAESNRGAKNRRKLFLIRATERRRGRSSRC